MKAQLSKSVYRLFGNQEPVYFLFDRVLRPILLWLARSSARFRFAILCLCKDIDAELDLKDNGRIRDEDLKSLTQVNYHWHRADVDEGIPLEQRRSHLILQQLEPLIPGARLVAEIGCGNGLFIENLARKFPAVQFVGIEFVAPSSNLPNLTYRAGYALDLLESIKPDLVYSQLVAVKFLPKEAIAYFELFDRIGVRTIVLNEPTRKRRPIGINGPPGSAYLDGMMWKHDYPGLAREHGYRVTDFRFDPLSKLVEPRYNVARGDSWFMRMTATR